MVVDELALKLIIDRSQVGPALQAFQNQVTNAASKSAKSITKLDGEGEKFRNMLQEITKNSPIMGGALMLALNPVVGLIAGATALMAKFVEKQKEAASQAEKLAIASAVQGVGFMEARYSDDPQKARRQAALQAAKAMAEKSVNDFTEEAERRVRKSGRFTEAELSTWGLFGGTSKALMAATVQEAAKMRADAVTHYEKLLQEESKLRKHDALVKEWDEYFKKSDEYYDKREKQEKDLADERIRLENKVQQAKNAADIATLHGKATAMGQFSDYQPTVEELAMSGGFTPWAAQARQIAWLENKARWQIKWRGDVAGAKETIFGKGGVRQLREQLESTGLIKPQIMLERIQEQIADIRAKGLGVIVQNME